MNGLGNFRTRNAEALHNRRKTTAELTFQRGRPLSSASQSPGLRSRVQKTYAAEIPGATAPISIRKQLEALLKGLSNHALPVGQQILTTNAIIRGFCNHYRTGHSSVVFSRSNSGHCGRFEMGQSS